MDTPITRAQYEEFGKRIDEENHRQNRRLEVLEDSVRQIGALTSSIEKLAANMESMVKEQEKQGKRLEVLEGRDGEKWRYVARLVVTSVIGIVIGYVFAKMGIS